jgi:competence protein ComEA
MHEHTGVREIVVEEGWRERLERLGGRRRDVWIVVGVVAVAVVIVSSLRARGQEVVAPPAVAPAPTASSASSVILVHVAGAVRTPGLYELPSDARVADAVAAAGGPRREADLDALNLAEVLKDGLRIEVPRAGEPPAASPAASPGTEFGSTISVNTADQAALETVPEIGPVTAAAIIAHREEIGSFSSVEQLIEVDGIGPATLETILPYLSL